MPMEHENELAEIGVRLTDDAYIAWHAAESECERAFRGWSHSGASNRAAAYCIYRPALDREEGAARDLWRPSSSASSRIRVSSTRSSPETPCSRATSRC